jgi:isochorismate synthase
MEENSKIIALSKCLEKNISLFIYRLPNTKDIIIGIQKGGSIQLSNYEDIDKKEGFLISKFEHDNNSFPYLIQPDWVFKFNELKTDVIYNILESTTSIKEKYPCDVQQQSTPRQLFIQQVKKIQNFQKDNSIQKAVLSRIFIEPKKENISPIEIFLRLCTLYSDAFIYFFNIPEVGSWIGASPEPFLHIDDRNALIESIAGTQWLNNKMPETLEWGMKEIEEQEIVSHFIEDKLQQIAITDYRKEGPVTFQAGQIAHLKTSFVFDKSLIEGRIGEFIQTFHPTPSLGGYPQRQACEILKSIEQHDREFYTGIIGPLKLSGQTSLFANIRCMKILNDLYQLYLGAGITLSSSPELEWEETNYKKSTILAALK